MEMKTVPCPYCQKSVEWKKENKYRPFCSERCKLIDLGEWNSERYSIETTSSHDLDELE